MLLLVLVILTGIAKAPTVGSAAMLAVVLVILTGIAKAPTVGVAAPAAVLLVVAVQVQDNSYDNF
jgi:hypothetical protein